MNDREMRAQLFVNGHRVAEAGRVTVAGTDTAGRALVTGTLEASITVALVVDPAELAAIHAKKTFGFSALRAMLDALPKCDILDDCGKNAMVRCLYRGGMVGHMCDEHANGMTADVDRTELPYAPAVRHIEQYVRDWERERKLPEHE